MNADGWLLETERLLLRRITLEDAPFIFGLVNDPAFHRNIGDKGVRNLEDARDYIRKGPLDSYERFGFGMYLVTLKGEGTPLGMCGLVKRDWLADVDVGFAFMPQFRSRGYAYEAASAVVQHAKQAFGLRRIAGITRPDNQGSIRVLQKLGLELEGIVRVGDDGPEDKLFARDL